MKKLLQTALSLILILTMIVPMLVLPMQAETPITNASVEEPSTYAALAEGAPTGIANTESGYTASGYTDIDEGDGYVQIGTKTQADATVGENYIPKLYYFDNANAYYNATEKKLVWVATNTTLTAASDNSVADGKNQNVAGAVWYLAYWAEQNQADILEVEFRAGTKGTTLYYIGCFTRLSSTVSVKIDSNFKIILGNDGVSSHGIFNNMPALRSAGHGEFASDGKFTATTYAENTVDVTGFTDYEDTYFAYSFYKCNAITKIITPVITGEKMFDRCKEVSHIIVAEGATIENIGASTFKDCYKLETIEILGTVDPGLAINSTAFKSTTQNVTVKVNTEAEKGYFETALSTAGITNVNVEVAVAEPDEPDEPVELQNAVKAEGFSVRMTGYTGLRALFSYDLDAEATNEKNGYTLVSYGVFATSYKNFVNAYESNEDTLFADARQVTDNTGAIKYVPVYNADGSGANKYVDYSTRTFCVALINIPYKNALDDIYMAGYAIWTDGVNEYHTITTYDMPDGVKATNLYENTLGLTKTGIINSENTDDVCFWQVLRNGALETNEFNTANNADNTAAYTLTDGSFKYLDVDWHAYTGQTKTDGYSFNPTGVAPEASGVVWSVLKYTDDEYILVIRNKDKSTYTELSIPQYSAGADKWLSQYSFYAPYDYRYGDAESITTDASLTTYNPALTQNDYKKIRTMVVDHGITGTAANGFAGLTSVDTIVYPNGLSGNSNYKFVGSSSVKNVIWCHTDDDGNPVEHLSEFKEISSLLDLRGMDGIDITSIFKACTAVENVIFPKTMSKTYVESSFEGTTGLRRVWIDGASMPAEGTIDLKGYGLKSLKKSMFDVGSYIDTIKLPSTIIEIYTSFDVSKEAAYWKTLGANKQINYICSGDVAVLLADYVQYIHNNPRTKNDTIYSETATFADNIYINGKSILDILGEVGTETPSHAPTSAARFDNDPYPYEMKTDPEAQPLTMEAWINLEDSTSINTIFGNRPYGTLNALSFEVRYARPRIDFGVESDGVEDVGFLTKITLNTWTHLAIVIDKTEKEFRLYVNGEFSEMAEMSDAQAAALDAIVFTGNAGHPCVGAKYSWDDTTLNDPFRGQIASFSAYSDVRTAEEIQNDYYNDLKSPDKDGLALCYVFEKDGPSTYYDLSDSKFDISWKAFGLTDLADLDIPEDYDYSLMIIGDTQTLVRQDDENNYYALYDWLVDNVEEKKIRAVIGVGDITHNNIEKEWLRSQVAFEKLEGVVDHFPIVGNHDVMSSPYDSDLKETDNTADPLNYEKYLKNLEWDGENKVSYDGSMKAYYVRFEMGGAKYLFLGMGYYTTQSELNWAKGVLEAHEDYSVILSTHAYLDTDASILDQSPADQIHELVMAHSNIVLVLCGHMHTTDILLCTETRDDGTTVQAMLTNPQDYYPHAYLGVATGLYFKDGKVYVANHIITTEACLGSNSVRSFELDLVHEREEK